MRMALFKSRSGDTHELGFFLKLLDSAATAIAHTGAKSAEYLENSFADGAFIRNAAFNAFGNEFLCRLRSLYTQ